MICKQHSLVYPAVVNRRGYEIVLHSGSRATVYHKRLVGGRLNVTSLLGKGDDNPKTAKVLVPCQGLSLIPASGAGTGINNCAAAVYCVSPCLANQGQGPMPGVKGARLARTALLHLCPEWTYRKLNNELGNWRRRHQGTVGCRLNMFSDWRWEDTSVIDANPDTVFWDYTKLTDRFAGLDARWIRPNYHLTFSHDGHNWKDCQLVLERGGCVSVVFHDTRGETHCGKASKRQRLPDRFRGWPVIDGDQTDWRPGDPSGTVIGLRLKARTYASRNKAITDGFSIDVDMQDIERPTVYRAGVGSMFAYAT